MFNITNYESFLIDLARLNEHAKNYLASVNHRAQFLKIDDSGAIVYEVNTACNCHPEYETKSIEKVKFIGFLNENNFILNNK